MKKKQHKSGSRSLSPAERLPADILRGIFSYLDLKTLTKVTTVSKFWDEQIGYDPRWSELYFKELNRILPKPIPSPIARKKYFEIKKRIEKIKKAKEKNPLFGVINENLLTAFKNAVKKNDLALLQVLFKDKVLDINVTFYRRFTFQAGCCYDMTLLYYAALKENLDVIKLLLVHGADVTKEQYWWYGREYEDADDDKKEVKKEPPKEDRADIYPSRTMAKVNGKISILNSPHILSRSIKSLLCIGYAEHFLFRNDFETANNYFEESYSYDPAIINDYVQQVHQDKVGFRFHYDEELISRLDACYKLILELDRSQKAHDRLCIIS